MATYYASQLFNGLVSGGFIALMSLGLSIIFGMMRVVNFAHGALYMLGAYVAFIAGRWFNLPLWAALLISPLVIGAFGLLLERLLLRHLYRVDMSYTLLLTFGLTLIIEDVMRQFFAVQGAPFLIPAALAGSADLGFLVYPKYRLFVFAVSVVVCLGAWLVLEHTRVGTLVRAGTERPALLKCFGVNVPMLISGTFACGAGIAGLAGTLAAPIRNISPFMGQEMIALTFAVVVVGGMGSIAGSVVMGFVVGVLSAIAAIWYPQGSNAVIYVLMILVLLFRPGGLFHGVDISNFGAHYTPISERARKVLGGSRLAIGLALVGILLPWLVYPVLATDIILWGICAVGFDLLFAFSGLLSFGQAVFFGGAAYLCGIAITLLGLPPWAGFVVGTAITTVVAAGFGALITRKQGIYFSMTSFAFAQVVYFIVNELPQYTGGEDGLHGVVRGKLLGLDLANNTNFYYVALAIAALTLMFVFRVIKSPFGLSLTGTRENEQRMVSIGYSAYALRLRAYVLSAFVISIGGSLYVLNHEFVSLESVYWRASGEPIMMTLLGGVGTTYGPMIGALIVVLVRDVFSTLTDAGNLILGIIFVAIVMAFRRGVLGECIHYFTSSRARSDKAATRDLPPGDPLPKLEPGGERSIVAVDSKATIS